MGGRLRPAQASDAAGIARVHRDSWRATYYGLLPEAYLRSLSTERLQARWQALLVPALRGRVWVAEHDERVIGFVQLGPCVGDEALAGFAGEVFMLYVHPDHTEQGTGHALFSRAIEELVSRGLYWLVVWVVEGNYAARRFYERAGMQADGAHRSDLFLARSVPVVRYARPLTPVSLYDFVR